MRVSVGTYGPRTHFAGKPNVHLYRLGHFICESLDYFILCHVKLFQTLKRMCRFGSTLAWRALKIAGSIEGSRDVSSCRLYEIVVAHVLKVTVESNHTRTRKHHKRDLH